jgi:hypothetical protein
MNNYQDTFQKMAMKWPSALVARQEIYKITGGLISPRTMANLDSQGKGPRERIVRGGKVACVYPGQISLLSAFRNFMQAYSG